MAAISAMFLGLLSRGDHVLAGDQLYGRSLRMLTRDLPRLGIETSFADAGDADAMAAHSASEHFKASGAGFKGLMGGAPEIIRMDVVWANRQAELPRRLHRGHFFRV